VTSVKGVDVYRVPTDQDVERTSNTFRIEGRYATYYYEVKRSVECEQANVDGAYRVNLEDFAVVAGDCLLAGLGLWGDINADENVGMRDLVQLARRRLEDCSEL
jgi:hypothetical protein